MDPIPEGGWPLSIPAPKASYASQLGSVAAPTTRASAYPIHTLPQMGAQAPTHVKGTHSETKTGQPALIASYRDWSSKKRHYHHRTSRYHVYPDTTNEKLVAVNAVMETCAEYLPPFPNASKSTHHDGKHHQPEPVVVIGHDNEYISLEAFPSTEFSPDDGHGQQQQQQPVLEPIVVNRPVQQSTVQQLPDHTLVAQQYPQQPAVQTHVAYQPQPMAYQPQPVVYNTPPAVQLPSVLIPHQQTVPVPSTLQPAPQEPPLLGQPISSTVHEGQLPFQQLVPIQQPYFGIRQPIIQSDAHVAAASHNQQQQQHPPSLDAHSWSNPYQPISMCMCDANLWKTPTSAQIDLKMSRLQEQVSRLEKAHFQEQLAKLQKDIDDIKGMFHFLQISRG